MQEDPKNTSLTGKTDTLYVIPGDVFFVWNLLQFYWLASRGYRLQPWRSPYIQWRFETFLGKEAADLDARKFMRLSWKYRKNLKSFAEWAAVRRSQRPRF